MEIETCSIHRLDRDEYEEGGPPRFVSPQPEHYSVAIRIGMAVESLSRVTGQHHSYIGRSTELARSLAHRLANPDLSAEEILEHSRIDAGVLKEHLQLAAETLRWAAKIFGNDGSLNNPEL